MERQLKLLECLDQNSRCSLKSLAKELHVSKQSVCARLNQLESESIVNYVSIIDFFGLGYNNVQLYLKVQGSKAKEYRNKLSKLGQIKNITWISEFFGDFDLGFSIFYDNIDVLDQTLNKIYETFGHSIKSRELNFIKRHITSSISFTPVSKRKSILMNNSGKKYDLSSIEKKILINIESNARLGYAELANKLKISPNSIKYNIKKLEKEKVILGYKILLDYNKLGYLWNICILDTYPGSNIDNLINELKKEIKIPFISIAIDNKIIFDFMSKNYNELKDFLNLLKTDYSEIENYKILNVSKLNKLKNIF